MNYNYRASIDWAVHNLQRTALQAAIGSVPKSGVKVLASC